MRIEKKHYIGLIIGLIIIILDLIFLLKSQSRWFKPLLAIGILVGTLQFWLDIFRESKRQKEIEIKFLEFIRALVQTVKSGISIPKSILEISDVDYGDLTPYVKKLARQIEWGISLRTALKNFADSTRNKVIMRSVAIVIEAEKSGGNIDEVLHAVTDSVLQIKKIKDERRSNTYSQMVQGYLVFFIFIGIMLVLQVYLLPQLDTISGAVAVGVVSGLEGYLDTPDNAISGSVDFDTIFLWLIIIQAFFAGLLVGKFAEGELIMGLKHSLILMAAGYLIITTIRGF